MDEFVNTIPKKFNYETGNVYDTAWAARLPDFVDPQKPAFPQAMEWIRNRQLPDGSWGTDVVNYRFDRILSTLNSVICLKQWNSKSDEPLIQRAIKALTHYLAEPLQRDEDMSIGFELILPKLLNDCKSFGIVFRSSLIDSIEKERAIKMRKLEGKGLLKRITKNEPASWWYSVEAFDGNGIKPDQYANMIGENGTVCNCFSATVFVLTQNKQLTNTFTLIKNELAHNNGCLPQSPKFEIFDLAWGINYLYFAGFDMNDKNLIKPKQRLNEIWTQFELGVPANIGLPVDCDSTAVTSSALVCSQQNRCVDKKDIQKLLNFFDEKNNFRTYEGEVRPSISTNLNVLIAFNFLAKHSEIIELIVEKKQKTFEWLLNQIKPGQLIKDKWHISPFYATSRLILAFTGNDHKITEQFINLVLSMQHQDGGWGMSKSTLEETAYVVISLYHWINNGNKTEKIVLALSRSKRFLDEESKLYPLWISKTLYLPPNVVKTVVYSALFALENCDKIKV